MELLENNLTSESDWSFLVLSSKENTSSFSLLFLLFTVLITYCLIVHSMISYECISILTHFFARLVGNY